MSTPRIRGGWIWLAIALLIVGVLQVVSSVTSEPPALLDPASASPNGALALKLWLQRIGYDVHVARAPSLPISRIKSRSTLMLLEPQSNPRPDQLRALTGWVRAGGRLVIIADSAAAPGILSNFRYAIFDTLPAPIQIVQPLLAMPPTARLSGRSAAIIATGGRGVEVARTRFGPVVAQNTVGRGVVWVVSATGLLANNGIARADNRRLLLNLAGVPRSRVDLDQITFSLSANQPTSSNWLTGTAWGVVVLFGILMVLLYRGFSGRRLGPPIESHAVAFRPSVEYVLSMAGLLRRGRKRDEALLPYQRDLQRRLLNRYGSLDADSRALELLEPARDITEHQLIAQAAAIVKYENQLGRNDG